MRLTIILSLLLLICDVSYGGVVRNPQTGTIDYCVTISEEDGSPSRVCPNEIKFSDGTVTDNGDGSFSISNSGGGGGSGTVTSVTVSGSDGIEVDSGSPITTSGTIALGVNATTMRTTLNVENGATADQTEEEIEAVVDLNDLQGTLDTLKLTDDPILETEMDSLSEFDTQIGITGTASSSTYLRGDGSWATPSGGAVSDMSTATFYDSTGNATHTTSSSTVNLNSTLTNNDTDVFTLASDVVTIGADGFYLISYQVGGDDPGATRTSIKANLQLDTGGGYSNVTGSEVWGYTRTANDPGTASGSVVLSLSSGDKIRLVASALDTSFDTEPNGSALTFVQLKGTKGDTGATGPAGADGADGGAPTDVNYLVATSDAGLSNEIALGTTDDTLIIANGSTWESKSIPSCSNATTSKLLYNSSTNTISCGTDQAGGGSSNSIENGTTNATVSSTEFDVDISGTQRMRLYNTGLLFTIGDSTMTFTDTGSFDGFYLTLDGGSGGAITLDDSYFGINRRMRINVGGQTSCLAVNGSGDMYHDDNCNSTQDVGEEDIGQAGATAPLELETGTTTAQAGLLLDQNDTDQPMIDFEGTFSASIDVNFTTSNKNARSDSANVAGPQASNPGIESGWVHEGMMQISVNGTQYFIPIYSWEEVVS